VVVQRHDAIRDELAYLSILFFSYNQVQVKNRFNEIRNTNKTNHKDDLSIKGFWIRQVEAVVDVRVSYPDCKNYEEMNTEDFLKQHKT